MARPSFKASMGEDRVPLHLNLRQSQYDHLCQKANDKHTAKAEIVREALDLWLSSAVDYDTANASQKDVI